MSNRKEPPQHESGVVSRGMTMVKDNHSVE